MKDKDVNFKKIVKNLIGVAFFGAAIAGIKSCYDNVGEEVYRGNINGQEIIYEEGRIDPSQAILRNKNVMTIELGNGLSYILEDRLEETDIDWKSETRPLFEFDKLERVLIIDENKKRAYGHTYSQPDTTKIDGKHTKKVLERTTKIYNNLRSKIRSELRNEYIRDAKCVEESLR
ncbi:hypothetical protein K8R47_02480 [archaeon]|nr:hypothetical protein [archaeon]